MERGDEAIPGVALVLEADWRRAVAAPKEFALEQTVAWKFKIV
jgi:hypothetical protein